MSNSFRLKGDYSEVSNVNTGHNVPIILGGHAGAIIAAFICLLTTAFLVYLAVLQTLLLTTALTIFFLALCVCGFVLIITYTKKKRAEHLAERTEHEAAIATTRRGIRVIQHGPGWVLYLDHNHEVQYRGTVQMNKHLHLTQGDATPLLSGDDVDWEMEPLQ